MKIKGRALSRSQRNSSSWRVDGANAKRQAEFDNAIDKPTKPKSKKKKKGFQSYIDKYGRLYIKLNLKNPGRAHNWPGGIAYDACQEYYLGFRNMNGKECLEWYNNLIASSENVRAEETEIT